MNSISSDTHSQISAPHHAEFPAADGKGLQVLLTMPGDSHWEETNDASLRWLTVLKNGLNHEPFLIRATNSHNNTMAQLPLCFVRSRLFGRFLVSLPYINSSGVVARSDQAASLAIHRAVDLATELDCRFLELRHETPIEHPALTKTVREKVHMRMDLPDSVEELREKLKAKVRNQVKKGESQGFDVVWGREELLDDFYAVFSRNMRDLGTPVFGRRLFFAILEGFPGEAEFCVVRDGRRPVASALLIHGGSSTEVPSASSLRSENSRNPNMLMYYHLLARSVERGQRVFDLGRSSKEAPTYRFKKQWGAEPHPANWQYFVRQGDVEEMRPSNPKYRLMIHTWRRLPLWLANTLGPRIVRGIP